MAHFAELDDNNVVLRVLVVSDLDCRDADSRESEEAGIEFLIRVVGGEKWVQTSYNNKIRKQFAQPGYFYHEEMDMFIKPKPGENYELDETGDWVEIT